MEGQTWTRAGPWSAGRDDCLSKDMFEDVFSSTLLARKQVDWVDL